MQKKKKNRFLHENSTLFTQFIFDYQNKIPFHEIGSEFFFTLHIFQSSHLCEVRKSHPIAIWLGSETGRQSLDHLFTPGEAAEL